MAGMNSSIQKILSGVALCCMLFVAFIDAATAADGVLPTPSGLIAENKIITDGAPLAGVIANIFALDFLKSDGIDVRVNETDAARGIYSLIFKTCDIANTTRRIHPDELAEAGKCGINPVEHLIAQDAIAIVVHPANPLTGLTVDQIRKIYDGTYSNWKQVGGLNRPIVRLQLDRASGTQEIFSELVMKKRSVTRRTVTLLSIRWVKSYITTTPDAIGFIDHGLVDRSVKALPVNGIEQSSQQITDHTYPLRLNLYMYTNGQPFGVLRRFVEYAKTAQGRESLSAHGFIPGD